MIFQRGRRSAVSAVDVEGAGRVDADGFQVGVEQLAVVDLAVHDGGAVGVGLAEGDAARDLASRPARRTRLSTSGRGRSTG